jgi:hypothetical protein
VEDRHRRPAPKSTALEERRLQPRFKIEVGITITSRTVGVMRGHTVDISESGISAIIAIEVPVDELVELDFTLPLGNVSIYAMVRQRTAFRYGFQFVNSDAIRDVIRPTCRHLAVEQALLEA